MVKLKMKMQKNSRDKSQSHRSVLAQTFFMETNEQEKLIYFSSSYIVKK